MGDERDRDAFQRLKPICVTLLKHSQLVPGTVATVISHLVDLVSALQSLCDENYLLSHSLVSYTAFPLLSFLRRNELSSIPDRILELELQALSLLCKSWWWTCDVQTWEQLFMLCSAVIGDLRGRGKTKSRDDETKTAAVQCLIMLTRPRREEEVPGGGLNPEVATGALDKFRSHARSQKFIPILGQTLDSMLTCAESRHRALQLASLQELYILFQEYISDDLAPSVLPGVISVMTRLALGTASKGWANGDIVADTLGIMQIVIIKSVGDVVCIKAGLIRDITNLEDLAGLSEGIENAHSGNTSLPTARTNAWLRATSSQLLIAINSISSLAAHPNSTALIALATFSSTIISATPLTLSNLHPLLLSYLLSLSTSSYPHVQERARKCLQDIFAPLSKGRHQLLEMLTQITRDHLSAIPRLLLSHSDAKVEHFAGLIEAICTLTPSRCDDSDTNSFGAVAAGIGKLFGPLGGVEKWGWRILSVLEFRHPPVVFSESSAGQLMLEGGSSPHTITRFPDLVLQHVSSQSTQAALERMFVALGSASGEDALFAVEWFISVGRSSLDSKSVAGFWCACRLLEGISGVRLADANVVPKRLSRRVEKAARALARSMSEIWEDFGGPSTNEGQQQPSADVLDVAPDFKVEHTRGLTKLDETMGVLKHATPTDGPAQGQRRAQQPEWLSKSVALHVLCISAGILQARFTPLLIHTLYPILHFIVSPSSFASTTGLAALEFIASSASYATPANLLLSNFDYALDSVSRRLSRERLDVDAMKVLVLLVRLVGPDVVHRAADLVEECFARLDEYHGYPVLVDGLVEVLGEVVKAIEQSTETHVDQKLDASEGAAEPLVRDTCLDTLVNWFKDRHKVQEMELDDTDYGPAPRTAWGSSETDPETENRGENRDGEGPIDEEEPPSPVQALTKQIVSRSLYFLTHRSPLIRARILNLLASAVPVLPESSLLQSIHHAWPFILNRFSDPEAFVVSAAAAVVEALVRYVGSSMHMRVWDDIWPIFRRMLKALEASDAQGALTRRGIERAGAESAYANSFRLYCSIIKTMTASARHVHANDSLTWEVLLSLRRFLHSENHARLQELAVEFYATVAKNNEDAVWLVLIGTMSLPEVEVQFLCKEGWDIRNNANKVLGTMY